MTNTSTTTKNSSSSSEVPSDLIRFIRKHNKFIVAGHKEPDGDCVGSQLALVSVLKRLGKQAIPCSAGPFKRTEIADLEGKFTKTPTAADKEGAACILVDCSMPNRSGGLEKELEGLPLAVIDHHYSGDHAESTEDAPVYLDGHAPSVTYLVLNLIEAMDLSPTKEEAENLLFGLCTDTGFFRHVNAGGDSTFSAAARMISCGANPKKAYAKMYGGKSLDSRRLMGLVLARVEEHFGGKLLLSWENYEETQKYGLEGRDSDSLYQLLQSVRGMEAIVIIRQETETNCTIGFRSRDKVDVSQAARHFGGGGHKNASGASVSGHIADLRLEVLKVFEEIFKQPAPINGVPIE